MKKTIVVLTIMSDKEPREVLASALENRAHDFLQNSGVRVDTCQAAMQTTDLPINKG